MSCAVSASDLVPPGRIDSRGHYLIYLHGAILETQGRNASHPKFGKYDYDGIVRAFAERGFVVLSEVRDAGTTLDYADRVREAVRKLRESGVSASHITVMGHSKGGRLTIEAALRLASADLRYVILAGCFSEIPGDLNGRFLSIYDSSDRIASSCKGKLHGGEGFHLTEKVLHKGLGHGLFFQPREIWIDPAVSFARGRGDDGR